MGYVVRMPQLGMTMEEGVVHEWLVEVGESVSAGDVVAIVETEKTTNELEAREDGDLRETFIETGISVAPGTPIGFIGDPGEAIPSDARTEAEREIESDETATSASEQSASSGSHAPPDSEGSEIDQSAEATALADADGRQVAVDRSKRVSPRARSYAAAKLANPDAITEIHGTGPGGAITESDVRRAHRAGEIGADADTPAVARTGRSISGEREGSVVRRRVAEKMSESASTAPQVTLNRTVSVDAVMELKAGLERDRDLSVSVTDFLLSAVADALVAHPEFNAIYEDRTHKLAGAVNVGLAVDGPDGLVTPVITDADTRSLEEIHGLRQSLIDRVQTGDISMDEMANGTFTVTNLGHFGVESFDPLLNVPEVGILGVGTIREEPGDHGNDRVMTLSLTFDHRPVDGADAARFLDTIAEGLEHPLGLLQLGAADSDPFIVNESPGTERRAARAESSRTLMAHITSGRFEWVADEPEKAGGTDTAPTPVEQLLGSLAACLAMTIGVVADRRNREVESVTVDIAGAPPKGPVERIDVDIVVTTSEPRESITQVVETAERACLVNRLLDEGVDREISITIDGGPPA